MGWRRLAVLGLLRGIAVCGLLGGGLHLGRAPLGRRLPPVADAAFADAGVLAYGDAGAEGAPTDLALSAPVVGMAAGPTGHGYWLVAADGGIFAYGDTGFYGSAGSIDLYAPVVGMAGSRDGHGYWLVAADGGIFAFGDAGFYGSTGALRLAAPIVGMAPTPDGRGYWLVGDDGGVFSFGDAKFYGGLGGQDFPGWIVSVAATAAGHGYWLADANGGVYHFGDAASYGDNLAEARTEPISWITRTSDGRGYWLLEPDAFPVSFDHPGGGGAIVAIATSQVQADPVPGYFCNPYGPCEEWCALFATWVWQMAGIPIPSFSFVGDVYDWAAAHTAVVAGTSRPSPGDFVLYGSGPQNVDTAEHMGVVAQVWPDGAIDTVEGDAGPGPEGGYNVVVNAPFLPSAYPSYDGYPVFAYAVP